MDNDVSFSQVKEALEIADRVERLRNYVFQKKKDLSYVGKSFCTGIRMSPPGRITERTGTSIRAPFPFPREIPRAAICC